MFALLQETGSVHASKKRVKYVSEAATSPEYEAAINCTGFASILAVKTC